MTGKLGKRQHARCPEHFQRRLTRVGGLNRYGQPNFILVWGMSWTVRRGGVWEQSDGTYFRGYRDVVEDGRACWVLKQWKAPEVYGTPTMWFIENKDALSGLQILGDYPWKGQYETVQPLVWRGLVNGRLVVEAMPLNSMILDMIVPIVMKCQNASLYQRKLALQALKEKEDKERTRDIEAMRHDSKLAFTGPVSFSRQGCRTSLVDKKVAEISKYWQQAMAMMKGRGLGVSVLR